MKAFEMPRMKVVHLIKEDIVSGSTICSMKVCNGYDCHDCPAQCDGVYHCNVFKCTTYAGD